MMYRAVGSLSKYLALGFFAALVLYPLLLIVSTAVKDPLDVTANPFTLFSSVNLVNFVDAWTLGGFGGFFWNTAIITALTLLGTVALSVLAGYALARLEFRGKGMVFNAMLLILIVPFQLLMIPLYVMIVRGYLLGDTYLGMILPFAVNATAVFIFRQFFLQLPRELFESARLDGASEFKILTRIAIPLAKPAILTAVIVTFIGPWNEFLWPFLVTKQLALQPLAVALANFISNVAARQANPFGAILAGAVVLTIPAVALFLIFQKRFQATNLGSGIKG